MGNSDKVRDSRDGDQFHYLWAARRCLQLLSPKSNLVAVSIEGASKDEDALDESQETGEQLIDVAEYYGSENIQQADLIRYIQLKHSTKQADKPWPPSGLKKTIAGFAKRYNALAERFDEETLKKKISFCFVSNRPISSDFLETVEDIATNKAPPRHPDEIKKMGDFTGLNQLQLTNFCKILFIEGKHDPYWEQRNILFQNLADYLPDADADGPVQLKELVTRKALSESSENPTITKIDVLRALKTDESRLFPTPCMIEKMEGMVHREQEAYLIEQIVKNPPPEGVALGDNP